MASLLERMNLPSPSGAPNGAGPVRNGPKIQNRSGPYNRPTTGRPTKGNPDEPWKHDLFDANTGKRSLSARLSSSASPVVPPKMNFGMADKALRDALGSPSERGPKGEGEISIKGASMRGNVIQVGGLAKGTTPADVEAIFKQCGAITQSQLLPPSSPNSDVTVRLTYKNASDAMAAVNRFNGQQADGKTILVKIVGGVNATLGGRLGLGVVDGSVDVLMDSDSPGQGSKMRSDSILATDSRAHVLVAPPGADPKEYLPQTAGRGGRGTWRGRGGRRRGGGARMDVD